MTEKVDAFYRDCDEAQTAFAIFMARLFPIGSVNGDKVGPSYDSSKPTLISKLDLSSPLHLHPNDSATLSVVSVKLKGTENYQVWSCAMLLALKGKNKTGFIDGSCRRSKTDEVLGRQ
nr:ribonuclease H-like domain-containing protein [Tanacetum cinerariifolium]